MRIHSPNMIDDTDNTLTASSEVVELPAENIQDPRVSKQWRTTGDTDEYIVIDAGAGNTLTPSSAVVLGHNLTNASTVKIQGNATDSWGSPTIDETFTYNAGTMIEYFTGSALRYWRFHFADSANPDTYIQIGRLILGVYVTVTEPIQTAFPFQDIDTSIRDFSVTGEEYGNIGITYELYRWNFSHWDNTKKKEMQTLFKEVKTVTPCLFVPNEDHLDKIDSVYGVFNTEIDYNHIVNFEWNASFAVREVK